VAIRDANGLEVGKGQIVCQSLWHDLLKVWLGL